jgi:predicted AAA+ superfamily ATPase
MTMNDIELKQIITEIKEGKSVMIVGPTESGKTWFIENLLSGSLKNAGLDFVYLNGHNNPIKADECDVVIVDEFETFLDREFLERLHPEDRPYYTDDYVARILEWQNKLKSIDVPMIFIITRNQKEEITNLVLNIHNTDWGLPVKVFEYQDSRL